MQTVAEPRAPWPEIRFYLGSCALFFVAYMVVSMLIVAGSSILFDLRPTAIASGSMGPVIRTGDVVLFEAVPDELLGPGTVIGFSSSSGGSVTHRIVEVTDDGRYVTQGDANRSPDPQPVDSADVWGVGRMLVPYVGYPAAWIAQGAVWKTGLFFVVAAMAVAASRWALFSRFDPWLEEAGDA